MPDREEGKKIMNTLSLETQKLAALAVFGSLYDAKKDIYSVLGEFIKQLYIIKGAHSKFSVEDIREELNNQFGFDNIPLSVVKTAIQKMSDMELEGETHLVSITPDADVIDYKTISGELQKAEQESEGIIDGLCTFLEKQSGQKITEEEKIRLQQALYSYLLKEEYQSQYSELINLFILEHEHDSIYMSQLQQIVDGVLIQSALRYQSHPNQIDKFNNTLYIYLDTEIIFFLAGYNGALYQTLAQEFLEQVSNMNVVARKVHKEDKIKLRFFEEVDAEITDFFNLAVKIVAGEVPLDKTKPAMRNIIQGCLSASDIMAKRSDLNLLLKKYEIKLDNKINYYEQDKHRYNIENKAFYENVTDPLELKKIDSALRLLSHVNVRRGDRSQKIFNSVGCVLLTGDAVTIRISLDERVLQNGNVPLATTMSHLTNRFWFTTNQGFSCNPNIQSFKVATRARLALSADMAQKIQTQFRKLQAEHKSGTLSDDAIAERISTLQQYSLTPENLEVKQSAINEYYTFLKIGDVGKLLEERAIEKKKAEELIKSQNHLIAQQERTIQEQKHQLFEQDALIKSQSNRLAENERSIRGNEKTISLQDKRIRDLEERPIRILWHILLFLRFVLLWAIMLISAVLLIYTAIDMCNHSREDSLYGIVSASCSILGLIAALICIPAIKKTRRWLSYKSFNRQAVETIISKRRKIDNDN